MSKLSGVITFISDVQEVANAKKITFRVQECEGQYPQSALFEVFGNEKVDNFLKYNQVGDVVDVEYNLKSNESRTNPGVFFNTISAWKVSKSI
jgi:hypothetical protein